MKTMNLGEWVLKKKIYRWNGKLIIKIVPTTNKWVKEKSVRNWFKYRFPRNKAFRWLKSHLDGVEGKRLTGTVVLHRYKSSNRCYCLQYDMD